MTFASALLQATRTGVDVVIPGGRSPPYGAFLDLAQTEPGKVEVGELQKSTEEKISAPVFIFNGVERR